MSFRELEEIVMTDDRVDHSKLLNDLSKVSGTIKTVTVVDRVIRNSDGSALYEYIGSNATTIAGTQMIVENTFANLSTTESNNKILKIENIETDPDWETLGLTLNTSETTDKKLPRKIVGCMIGTDGAIGKTVKIVDRRSKGYDVKSLIPLYKVNSDAGDDAQERMHINENLTNHWIRDYDTTSVDEAENNARTNRDAITAGKYALRATQSTANDTKYTSYFVKLLNFNVTNIALDGTVLDKIGDERNRSLDVRTKVQTTIKFNAGSLSKSHAQLNEEPATGVSPDNTDTIGMTMSSLMLVAARPTGMLVNENNKSTQVQTYTDFIVTNKINFVELPIEDDDIEFRYTLYYV